MLIPVLIACGVLVGAILLALALRGSRINDHPHCRGCGFDLSGLAVDEPALRALRCPECGRELSPARSIRHGARRRRPRFVIAASLLLLIAAGFGGVYGWGRATKFNWNTIKPVWMLLMQAQRGDPAREPDAAKELARRAAGTRLSDESLKQIAVLAFEVHESSTHAWLPAYGDIIEQAGKRGLLTEESKQLYVSHMANISLYLTIASDGASSYRTLYKTSKSGTGILGLMLEVSIDRISFFKEDEAPADADSWPTMLVTPSAAIASATSQTRLATPPSAYDDRPDGRTAVRFRVFAGGTPGMISGSDKPRAKAPLFEWTEPIDSQSPHRLLKVLK